VNLLWDNPVLAARTLMSSQSHVASPKQARAAWLAEQAVAALLDEVRLTPKPGLVDGRGSGTHHDASLRLYERSARVLGPYFESMAIAASKRTTDVTLRETLGALGRAAEKRMLLATDGVNTHRGAIWSLGLLVAAAVEVNSPEDVCWRAGELAQLPDRHAALGSTHGMSAMEEFGVTGARGEAAAGFPHVREFGLPMLRAARRKGVAEAFARIDALMAIMSRLDDTCLLHRGGLEALRAAKEGAAAVLAAGGSVTREGQHALLALDRDMLRLWASPGGAADLLAATLFVDRVSEVRHA